MINLLQSCDKVRHEKERTVVNLQTEILNKNQPVYTIDEWYDWCALNVLNETNPHVEVSWTIYDQLILS